MNQRLRITAGRLAAIAGVAALAVLAGASLTQPQSGSLVAGHGSPGAQTFVAPTVPKMVLGITEGERTTAPTRPGRS